MEPKLQYLIPVRDATKDTYTNELVLIRPFDTIFILKGQSTVVYTFKIIGRLFLNSTGFVNCDAKIKILDLDGEEIISTDITAKNINAEIGVDIFATIFSPIFKKEGKFSIEVALSINGGEFKKLDQVSYFWVKKLQ